MRIPAQALVEDVPFPDWTHAVCSLSFLGIMIALCFGELCWTKGCLEINKTPSMETLKGNADEADKCFSARMLYAIRIGTGRIDR